ncbi:hypothetical protein NZL82_18565 [Sphingomonas sanguinis]|uniref:hypothetical protein n=1 Tax=Sphingomonas sp. LC-1 TaxID=3110957 RepID=UPI0021BB071B|nr:hypothetical protein [Sphingomonas sp. LC-1]MCT8003876.1 hypothetical protein [Sphingomonas sp. LC-1]
MESPAPIRSPASLLIENWTYTPSSPSLQIRRLRAHMRLLDRRPPPRHKIVVAPTPAARWNILFLFLPKGNLDADQRRIFDRLRRLSGKLLVIYASSDHAVPDPTLRGADALIWKDLPGFDFSAYALALDAVATFSSGADVYVQNDSVLGPFADIDAAVARAAWDLTGFIASAAVENHISSFAFILRKLTPERMLGLSTVLSTKWCHDDFSPVVVCQETMLARVAARSMTVGAFLFMPVKPIPRSLTSRLMLRLQPSRAHRYPMDVSGDATLGTPLDLLDRGFPFLKRSLFTKFAILGDRPALEDRLRALGW